jgi:hypothetical protein
MLINFNFVHYVHQNIDSSIVLCGSSFVKTKDLKVCIWLANKVATCLPVGENTHMHTSTPTTLLGLFN